MNRFLGILIALFFCVLNTEGGVVCASENLSAISAECAELSMDDSFCEELLCEQECNSDLGGVRSGGSVLPSVAVKHLSSASRRESGDLSFFKRASRAPSCILHTVFTPLNVYVGLHRSDRYVCALCRLVI